MKRSILTGTALALTTAGLIAGPAQAAGPNACVYNPTSKIASVNLVSGGFTQLEMEGDKLVTFDAFGKADCRSASGVVATRANTASVLMIGTAAKEDFIVSYMGGTYNGGAAGGSDPSKIEVNVLSDASDIVDVAGTNGPDVITVSGGTGTGKAGNVIVNTGFNGTPGIKMTFNPSLVRVHGLSGGDLIAGSVFMPPTSMLLELDGDADNDSLFGGLIGGDRLDGGAGNDTLDSRDGQAFDILVGGSEFDSANMDKNDQAVQVEQVAKTVGKLALTASKVKGGESTVRMSWEHPRAWKQLASLELAAFDGTERVGSITMTPATGKLAAHGALQLTDAAKLSHKGKAVTATLGLKVDGSVPAGGLRLQVKATDKAGNQQTELGAGFLR